MPRPAKASAAALHEAAPTFAALGDENRLRIVSRLCHEGPLSIARLTEGTDVTRQAITKHLQVMEAVGLVHGARQGREQVWELDVKRVEQARRHLAQISADWDRALGRLKRWVED